MTCNESPAKEKKKALRSLLMKELTSLEESGGARSLTNVHCAVELQSKFATSGLATTDGHLRKTIILVKHSCLHSEMYTEEVEVKNESENSTACLVTPHYESDAEPSGSVTPLRTDGEDNDKLSTSDNQSGGGGRMMSPGRGRGNKRKRAAYNRHSIMVIDRKYIRSKVTGKDERKDDDSYGEEEEEEATRDTFISMKNKTYRLMEQEQSLDKFDLLGLPPIDDLSFTTDDAIEILEKRLSDLREVYHQSKLELLHMEKRRRKRAEKKSE
ncbi:unnamed protein product [Angiostrongylus costaricensis]|uniref:Transcriptional regulator ATRX homolog n=1 Tax=Angiostrongylus costaricensis TaxID=334426 RepID=A0A0R3PHS9_ANGCS|nr:unnamed protein product [Angiostrongylus costaricensis]